MNFNGLFSNVYDRLNDWLNNTSATVAGGDLALDLLNRGRERLCQEADWEPLVKKVVLNVVNLSVTLPADCAKIVYIDFDPLGYGKPVGYFNKDGDLIYGYKTIWEDDGTGFNLVQKLKFFFALPYTPELVYVANPPVFVASQKNSSGAVLNPQNTMFPEGLLLRSAQLEHVVESGVSASDYQILERDYYRQLSLYKSKAQYVNADWRNEVRDDSGNKVRIASMDATGGQINPRPISPSLDVRWGI